MHGLLTPHKTQQGWVVDVPPEMAQAMGVAEGSQVVLHTKEGGVEVEVLPPPPPDLKSSVQRIHGKYKDAFEAMKRLGT